VRQLRSEKAQSFNTRVELEQILSDCINEVKKEIAKRRTNNYKYFISQLSKPIGL